MAYVGSAPAACSATVSSEVVVVLPWVPATATTRRPAITAASAAERGSTRRPAAHGLDVLGVVLADRGRDDERVGVGDLVGGVAEVDGRAQRRAAPASVGESVPSLPLTAMPRASMIRAMPDRPAPPMPTKWTRPSRSAGRISSGTGTFTRRSGRPRGRSGPASRRRRAGSAPTAAAPIAASRSASVASAGHGARRPSRW